MLGGEIQSPGLAETSLDGGTQDKLGVKEGSGEDVKDLGDVSEIDRQIDCMRKKPRSEQACICVSTMLNQSVNNK